MTAAEEAILLRHLAALVDAGWPPDRALEATGAPTALGGRPLAALRALRSGQLPDGDMGVLERALAASDPRAYAVGAAAVEARLDAEAALAGARGFGMVLAVGTCLLLAAMGWLGVYRGSEPSEPLIAVLCWVTPLVGLASALALRRLPVWIAPGARRFMAAARLLDGGEPEGLDDAERVWLTLRRSTSGPGADAEVAEELVATARAHAAHVQIVAPLLAALLLAPLLTFALYLSGGEYLEILRELREVGP